MLHGGQPAGQVAVMVVVNKSKHAGASALRVFQSLFLQLAPDAVAQSLRAVGIAAPAAQLVKVVEQFLLQ